MPARPTLEMMDRLGTVYQDRKGEWRWTIRAKNGRKIANSGEGYKHRSWCFAMCMSFGVLDENITVLKPRKKKKI